MKITATNLVKKYKDTTVLRGVSFSMADRETLSIVGSSGSGKSTLLYLLGGLEKLSSGSIDIDGQDLASFNDQALANFRNKHIGFVFQFHFLLPSMNCLDNILLPAKIGGHKVREIKKRVLKYASLLKVEHCLKKYPFEISGGEQQRINIIRAISLNPGMLLCDEPTGNLDSKNTEIVLSLLKNVAQEIGSSLVVVTHDSKVANSFTRKITIEDGQIIS